MEFARFGGNIPTEYWGCCAASVIQNFNQHPNTKASSQLVLGDSGSAILRDKELAFCGPTLRDIFEARIRIGEFSDREMPNHAFFAILTESQCNQEIGKLWLAILKENGFEYLRTVNNSVWNVNNHIFVLIRNVGPNARANMFQPPKSWTDLPSVVPEPWSLLSDTTALTKEISEAQKTIWNAGKKPTFLKESEIVKADAPVIMSGLRSEFPPELKLTREEKIAKRKEANCPVQPACGTQHNY